MAKKTESKAPGCSPQTAIRFPAELVERIDTYAEELRREHPGVKFSRSDIIRLLINRALDQVDALR